LPWLVGHELPFNFCIKNSLFFYLQKFLPHGNPVEFGPSCSAAQG
jgi:hypothetical protein